MMPDVKLQILVKAYKEMAEFLGKKLDAVSSKLDLVLAKPIAHYQQFDDTKLIAAIKEAGNITVSIPPVEVPEPKVTVNVPKIDVPKIPAIKVPKPEVTVNVPAPKVVVQAPDNTAIIKAMQTALKDYTGEVVKAIKDIKVNVPSTIKLDEMQVRAMRSERMPLNPAPQIATRARVTNVAMATADTEYNHTFASGATGWELRLRDTNVPLLVAYESGKFPTSGDGSAYFTVPAYYLQTNSNTDWSHKKVYLQTGSADQVLEIIEYLV